MLKILAIFILISLSVEAEIYTVMCVGDSITVGTGGASGGYRDDLRDMVPSINYVGPYGSFPLNHAGASGEETGYIKANILSWLQNYMPLWVQNPYILLHIGTNDVYAYSVPYAASVQNISDTLDIIFAYNPSIKVMVCLITPLANVEDSNVDGFNSTLSTMLDAYGNSNVMKVDMNSAFKANEDWGTDYFTIDTTHPNDNGYAVMALTFSNNFEALPADSKGMSFSGIILNGGMQITSD